MRTMRRLRHGTVLAALGMIAAAALRCTDTSLVGGNTSTVDNIVCGVLYNAFGGPAVDATVAIRSYNYIARGGLLGKRRADETLFACSTRTDTKGHYRFTKDYFIPQGKFIVEARDSSGNCVLIGNEYIDGFLYFNNSNRLSREFSDTLKPPCTIKGTIKPLGDSLSGAVYVYGLDIYAPLDWNGGFVLENVPAGILRLKIVAVENGTARNDTISVTTHPADTVTIPELPTPVTIGVDAAGTFQTIDGFGASSAWTGQKITADLATVFWKDDTIDGHIGLSLLRTRIDAAGYTLSESSPMTKAIEVNPDIRIWSTSWTPPGRFKDNNSPNGGHINSDSASMEGFADHLVNYVHDVKTATGIDLYAVSCQNEPDYAGSGSDGCLWTPEQIRIFLKDYWGPAFEKAGISTKRMIGESVGNDLTITDPSLLDPVASGYADIIGTHLYEGGPHPYPLADSLDMPYWVTEISGLDAVDTSIADALMWANTIHDCLVRCNMNAFHYWWLVNIGDQDDEGLCNSNGQPTPRMYALGNFSKFIRPGFVRVAATGSPAAGVRTSAYYGRELSRLVIVAINGGAAKTVDVNLSGISGGDMVVPWLTDSTRRLQRQQPVMLSNGNFSFVMPSGSIVTFVLGDVAAGPN